MGDFLIKSVHNLRKHIKNSVFFDIPLLPADSSKPISVFSTHFAAEGRTFFFENAILQKNIGGPVARFLFPWPGDPG